MKTFHRDSNIWAWGTVKYERPRNQTRHLNLVLLTNKLFKARMGQGRARGWEYSVLTTIGQAY